MESPSHSDRPSHRPPSARICSSSSVDVEKVWRSIRMRAEEIREREHGLRSLLEEVVLGQPSLGRGLCVRLSRKLAREDVTRDELDPLLTQMVAEDPAIEASAARDLCAIVERDPACDSALQPLLFFKGFMAISTYRLSHHLWKRGRRELALYFQSLSSEVFGVDIHPAARIGCGIFLDHATSFVVGETAIVEDDVSILHEVTLGGTGKVSGDRHPIVRSGVLIGAGAKILGRVEIGQSAKVGAGSVVLSNVPPHVTVAGVPAEIVGESAEDSPALAMDQSLVCRRRDGRDLAGH